MANPFDPFADMRALFRSVDETRRLLEEADPLRSLREIQDQMRVYQPLFDSAKTGYLALQPVFPTEILTQVNQLASLGDRIKELLPRTGSLTRLTEATTLARDWLRDLAAGSQHLEQLSELQQHLRQGILHPLPTALEELNRIADELTNSSLFEQSFAAQMAQALSTVVRATSPEELERSIESAERVLLERAEKTPVSRLSREAWLSILLTLLLFVLDQANSLKIAKETIAHIQAVERRVLSTIESPSVVEGADQDEYWVVLRALDVRAEPNDAAKHLGLVYPGRTVLEIESRGGWLRIEYFADSSATLSQGWVRGDGLQKLDELSEHLAPLAPEEVTEAMNQVVAEVGETSDPFVTAAARRVLERTEW